MRLESAAVPATVKMTKAHIVTDFGREDELLG